MTKRPKIDKPTAVALLAPARATRERMQQEGGDFSPMVIFVPKLGKPMMAVMAGEGRLPDQLAVLLEDMRSQLGPAQWIAVTTDAYTKQVEDPTGFVPGSLEAAFKAGDPHVTEQMMVVLRQRNKPTEVAGQAYRYTPVDGWEWDPPEVMYDHQSVITAVLDMYL